MNLYTHEKTNFFTVDIKKKLLTHFEPNRKSERRSLNTMNKN